MLGLLWGRPVLIPIALAMLLSFLLTPIVKVLQAHGLGRLLSVLVTVSTVAVVCLCLGWMVTRQVTGLLAELPENTANIRAKVKTLRQLGSGPFADRFGQMIEEIGQELTLPSGSEVSTESVQRTHARGAAKIPAEVVPGPTTAFPWLSLTGYLGSAFEVLATAAFSLVLLVFFLLGRDDLRDRLVMLAGSAQLTVTSKALEDITDRISRYIVMVVMLNGGFGLLMAIGLFLLGVPYALLWGFLSGGMRFIPYIGPWVGALFPVVMSLATFEGWWQPLTVIGFVVMLELISNNIVEPLVFGRSTGVSPTALLVSAAVWLYLWGPLGLVLSAPFAVCLVVLGKNIPQLRFLYLLLGDKPALQAKVGYYQRLMLGDEHEAVRLVRQRMLEEGARPDDVYDDMLVPTMNYLKRDLRRGLLTDGDQRMILAGLRESLRQAGLARLSLSVADVTPREAFSADLAGGPPVDSPSAVVLGCPATDELDGLGLEMLQQLLDPLHWRVELTSTETLVSELVARLTEDPPNVVCIASLPPGGLAHARYLCKRLRDASPEIEIIVGRWGRQRSNRGDRERLEVAGASFVTTTLLETRKLLESRRLLNLPITSTAVLSGVPELTANAGVAVCEPGV